MNKELITERINAAPNMKEAEIIAEKLTYEISYEHKFDTWRSRYEYLKIEDFREIGWNVIPIGTKTKFFETWILQQGFKKHGSGKTFYNVETKTMFMVDDYAGSGVLIGIDNYRQGEPTDLITIQQYKDLLIGKLTALLQAKERTTAFINSLISEHKEYLEQEIQEELRERIISQALEKAKEEGLIL